MENNENSFRTVNIVNNNHNNNNITNNKNKKHESNSGEWKSHNVSMPTKDRNGLNVQAQELISQSSINNSRSLNNRTGYHNNHNNYNNGNNNNNNSNGNNNNGLNLLYSNDVSRK